MCRLRYVECASITKTNLERQLYIIFRIDDGLKLSPNSRVVFLFLDSFVCRSDFSSVASLNALWSYHYFGPRTVQLHCSRCTTDEPLKEELRGTFSLTSRPLNDALFWVVVIYAIGIHFEILSMCDSPNKGKSLLGCPIAIAWSII